MFVPLLVLRNAFRHKLRTALTVVGIVVAITAFGLLRTIVDAWYAGAEASSSARARHAQRDLAGVLAAAHLRAEDPAGAGRGRRSSWANWFGGVYITERNFFPQFAIDAPTYLDMYPEFVLSAGASARRSSPTARARSSGRKLAEQYGWKVGDQIPLRGTIYPGHVDVHAARHLRRRRRQGPTRRSSSSTGDYLNETIKKRFPRRGDQIGVLIVEHPATRRRRPRFRRRSTRRSRTRSPRR